jgi:hypothetical protein
MTRRSLGPALAGLVLVGCDRLKSKSQPSNTPAKGEKGGDPREALDASELRLDYAIYLEDGGSAKPIDEKHHFRSGEQFRIELRPAFPAHIYLLNRGPRQERYSRLFPVSGKPLENPLEPNRAVMLPGNNEWYTLDNRPGVENVVLIAAAFPLVEFNTPEQSIPRDECEDRIALLERDYRPSSSRRFEDKGKVKLFAAREAKTVIVLRLPLDHR